MFTCVFNCQLTIKLSTMESADGQKGIIIIIITIIFGVILFHQTLWHRLDKSSKGARSCYSTSPVIELQQRRVKLVAIRINIRLE